MPGESFEGTPKPISKTLINFGVKHWKSPSRPCECEQDILSGPCRRSSPDGTHNGIIRNPMIIGWRIPPKLHGFSGPGRRAFPSRATDWLAIAPAPSDAVPLFSRPSRFTSCVRGIVVGYDGCILTRVSRDPVWCDCQSGRIRWRTMRDAFSRSSRSCDSSRTPRHPASTTYRGGADRRVRRTPDRLADAGKTFRIFFPITRMTF